MTTANDNAISSSGGGGGGGSGGDSTVAGTDERVRDVYEATGGAGELSGDAHLYGCDFMIK